MTTQQLSTKEKQRRKKNRQKRDAKEKLKKFIEKKSLIEKKLAKLNKIPLKKILVENEEEISLLKKELKRISYNERRRLRYLSNPEIYKKIMEWKLNNANKVKITAERQATKKWKKVVTEFYTFYV